MDTNGDGTLSQIEFKAGPIGQKNPTLAETYFKKLDQNGDGKLTQEEFTMRRTLPRSGEQAAGSIVPAVSSPHYTPRRYSPHSALDRKRR